MRRRKFVALLGGVVAAWPFAARAQQKAMPVIGVLYAGPRSASFGPFMNAFRQGLSEAGYVEGQNLAIEYRWAEDNYDRLPALAAELVDRKVDLIMASSPPSALAAKSATSTIPIVFRGGADPVGDGLVASLARPGGNLTGVSFVPNELTAKRLELLSELVPQAGVIALLVNPNSANTERVIRDVQEAARTKGLQLHVLKASSESEIDTAFASLVQLHAGALVVGADPFLSTPARADRGAGIAPCSSGDICVARVRRFRRPDQLWIEPHSCLSPGRRLRGKGPQGRQARRSAGRAADQIRAGDQSEDCQSARPRGAANAARPCRRGDRIGSYLRQCVSLLLMWWTAPAPGIEVP